MTLDLLVISFLLPNGYTLYFCFSEDKVLDKETGSKDADEKESNQDNQIKKASSRMDYIQAGNDLLLVQHIS